MYNYIPIVATILSGGLVMGVQMDKISTICEEMNSLKRDHKILKEKVYDIHTKVCLIDQKISQLTKVK